MSVALHRHRPGWARPWPGRWAAPATGLIAAVAVATAHELLVPLLAISAIALLAATGPRFWMAAWLVIAALGVNPAVAAVGNWDVRLADLPLAVLFIWAALRGAGRPAGALRPLWILGGWVGVATLVAGWREPAYSSDAWASAVRLMLTLSAAWAIARLTTRPGRQVWLLRTLAWAAAAGAALTAAHALQAGGRAGAFGGPNTAGLVAALVVVLATWRALGSPLQRLVLAAAGLAGLIGSMSVGSILAAAVGVLVGQGRGHSSWVRRFVRGALAGALALVAIGALRPEVLPWRPEYRTSSAAVRQTVAYAGFKLFQHHPLIGTGWQRSGRPGVINDPSVVAAVRSWAPDLRDYAAVSPEGVTSVHNAYVQVLAEGGLLGVLLVGWAARSLVKRLRWLHKREVRFGEPHCTSLLTRLLVVVAVWWNDNPLFGGQTETMLFAVIMGVLAASFCAARCHELKPEPGARGGVTCTP